MWYKNIAGRFFGLVTKHACDGQNYDSQDRASIAACASRGKNREQSLAVNTNNFGHRSCVRRKSTFSSLSSLTLADVCINEVFSPSIKLC